jgi:lysyl-tRNA synthetase class 2
MIKEQEGTKELKKETLSHVEISSQENAEKRRIFWANRGKSLENMPFPVFSKLSHWENAKEGEELMVAGRIIQKRHIGSLTFMRIVDYSANIQIILHRKDLADYDLMVENLSYGDIVALKGMITHSKTGERSISVGEIHMIACNHRIMPDKWYGLEEDELRHRNTYMLCARDEKFKNTITLRIQLMAKIRTFFQQEEFLEVETPILQNVASGAAANPFSTHHNALGINLYLRIAPELRLKTMVAAGYTKIFELGKNFRNEGIDPTHLQEFTMLECYAAYWHYKDYIPFTKKLFNFLFQQLNLPTSFNFRGEDINLEGEWPVYNFTQLILEKTAIDIEDQVNLKTNIVNYLQSIGENYNVNYNLINNLNSTMGLVDFIYKKICRPKIIQPTFLLGYPSYMAPLATEENGYSTKLQLVIAGIEFINAYGELVDPAKQEANFIQQEEYQTNIKNNQQVEDIFPRDNEFLDSMKYGMPPMAGFGMGIDRLLSLLSCNENLKNTLLFPLVTE